VNGARRSESSETAHSASPISCDVAHTKISRRHGALAGLS
jgi:hypothetical protein